MLSREEAERKLGINFVCRLRGHCFPHIMTDSKRPVRQRKRSGICIQRENPVRPPDVQSERNIGEVPRLAYRFRQASKAIAVVVASLGLVVLGGWAFHVPALTYIRPSFQSMKLNTALSFLCLGAGLWLAQDDKWQRSRRILGFFVVIIAGLTLAEYAFHASLGIDQLLFRDTRTPSLSAYPGRMAIATATCFLLLGLAVTLLGTKKAVALQRSLVAVCFAISLVALCGYLYGVHSLYSITAYSTVAVHTAAGILATCLAYFLSQPDQGIVPIAASKTYSGLLLRTVVPVIIVVPIVIGWLRLAGQRAGLYDTAFGVALQVIGCIVCLTALTLVIARSMNRMECERSCAEQTSRESEERLRLAQWADRVGTFEWNIRTGVNIWTPELEAIYGLPPGGFGGTLSAFENLVHPDDRGTVMALCEKAVKTQQPTTGEWRVVWPDGSVHWIAGRGQVLLDESGEPSRILGVNMDITERKRAEQELTAANERLHLAIEAGSIGGFDYDLRTGKNVWFGKAHTLLGMSPDETPGSLQEFWDRVHKDDRKRLQRAIQGASETNEGFSEDFRVVWRDGTTHWLRSRGRYCYAANGKRQRMVGISIDVTERKLAEEALRESEERLRLAALAGRMFAYEWDAATDVIKRSGDFAQILGSDEPVETTGQQILGRIHPDDRESVKAAIAALSPENPHLQISYRMARRDGTFIWVDRNSLAHFDEEGRMLRLVGMVADVTERKRAEQALQEINRTLGEQSVLLQSREELLRVFVKNVPAAVAMLDRDMRYLQVSDRWCSDYLSGRDQVLGRSHYEIFPDMPERWKEVHRRALQGETLRADEDRWDGQDGTHWARWEVRPWKTPEGTVGGILILAEDISRRKQMEEALSGMTRKLVEAQEQERTRIARELHDDITQRLAMLAIEIEQTPEHHPEMPSQVRDRAQELSMRVKGVSNDIQALSHELHSSKLDYLGVARGMKSWCDEFGERRGMDIEFKSSGLTESLVPEISLCLFRVLQEALHNAAKHSGVKRVDVRLWEESGEIQLTVSDSGKGFDVAAAMQDRGLGITSMQERLRLVGGTIVIDSKPLGGTTIRVRVPLTAERSSQMTAG
jgi:PAS domain S-box-containing protein